MNIITKTVLTAVLTTLGSGLVYGGYKGLVLAGDSRYVRQDAWIQEKKTAERRQLQRMMVPLKVKASEGKISAEERALLETYKSQLEELEK